MHFDDTEELKEPKLCCYRKGWIASRALIWALISVGATLFSIGYVLNVFTAHYKDDEKTASIFETSGLTLVAVGAALTGIGVIACFHSCCVVLCYRPANKPENKTESQKSNSISECDNKALIPTLPNMQPGQARPLLSNGGFHPVPGNPSASPPQRSATSPRFFPVAEDESPSWSRLHAADKRKHQSQGNVNQSNWQESNTALLPDQSPEAGQSVHPYSDDYLQEQLRKNMTATAPAVPISELQENRQISHGHSTNQRQHQFTFGASKPVFRVGGQLKNTTDRATLGDSVVWQHQRHSESAAMRRLGSTNPNKSPLPTPRSANSARQRQYFHEEHFTFSDFEPDDAFMEPHELPIGPRTETALRAALQSSGTPKTASRFKKPPPPLPHSSKGSPKPIGNIPSMSDHITAIPVSAAVILPAAHPVQQQSRSNKPVLQPNVFRVETEPISAHLTQAPLSGGSTSSGRGSGSRGIVDQHEHLPAGTIAFVSGAAPLQPNAAVVTVSMASPCLIRRASPATYRRAFPPSGSRSHEQTPEHSGPDQDIFKQPVLEMTDFVTQGERMILSPIRTVHQQSDAENVGLRSTVITQPASQRHYSIGFGGVDADNDSTFLDPEDAFPTPKKSPDRLHHPLKLNAEQASSRAPATTFVNVNDRPIDRHHSPPGVVSSAQESYLTTQAFLCEQEEII